MGATNVAAVYLHYGGKLDDGAMRLLAWMALVSLDNPNPMLGYDAATYWEAWTAQAAALGHREIPTDGAKRDSLNRSVRRVRGRLVEAGAIELIRSGSGARRAPTWRVMVEGPQRR